MKRGNEHGTSMGKEKEITFLTQQDLYGVYIAWAQGYDTYTQAGIWEELLEMIKDVIRYL